MKYDYTIVGAGLYGCTFASRMVRRGRKVLVLEKASHVGGNAHTFLDGGILIHAYGPHLFRTNCERVWNTVRKFGKFHRYEHRVKAVADGGKVLTVPFCMQTFCELWGYMTVAEAKRKLVSEQVAIANPANLEEQALSMVGPTIYEALIKGYTEKQWGRPCTELPASIIKRLPLRFDWDDRYSTHKWQGVANYTEMCLAMLEGCDVRLNSEWNGEHYGRLVWSGPLDALFGYDMGRLEYRGLKFEHVVESTSSFQGMGQINCTSRNTPYTRIIEHRFFMESCSTQHTVCTIETPQLATDRPYYPINDEANEALARRYRERVPHNVLIGGRLGTYKYFDMDQVVGMALADSDKEP